jgi:hypothetical protein
MGPARRRRRLGRAHAQGLGEGAPALGGPRWATLPRAGVGLGVAGPGGGEKGKRGEGRLRLGYARVGHAPTRGGGLAGPCALMGHKERGGMALFLFSSFFLYYTHPIYIKKNHITNGYTPKQNIRPKQTYSNSMHHSLFPIGFY